MKLSFPSCRSVGCADYSRGSSRGDREQHWGIENQLHWRLDVSMNEDQCRLRIRHGAENFSRLRRIALNKLKRWEIRKANGKVRKTSLRLKQKACSWSHKLLIEALFA